MLGINKSSSLKEKTKKRNTSCLGQNLIGFKLATNSPAKPLKPYNRNANS
jgi:hypothetical protein